MTVDYDALAGANTQEKRENIVSEAFASGDYVYVTDAIANRNKGGSLVLKYFDVETKEGMLDPTTGYREDDRRRKFKIFCKRDANGTEYKPGDVIEWEVSRGNRDSRGNKLTGQQINDMAIRGERDKLYRKKRFVVDEKGCIEAGYVDASALLTKFGTHYKSGLSICGKREFSRQRFTDDHDKVIYRNIWYWRFYEVSPTDYENLPVLTTGEDTKVTTRKKPGPKPKQQE